MSTPATQVTAPADKFEVQLRNAIEHLLPKQIPLERFERVVKTAIQQSPDLRNADKASLFTSCVKAATDGLLPDGREAALVIFNTKEKVKDENGRQVDHWIKKVQYMPMVAGILKKVRNSGELKTITTNVVYERDKFRYWIDDSGEHITFEPNILDADRGKKLAAFALAETKDGGVYIEVMGRSQIEQVRNVSKTKDNGPWVTWEDEMWRKTVTRRLSKRLPMSTDLEQVIHRDDELYELNQQRLTATSGTGAAKAMLGLPTMPDADDVAAARVEHVDHDTGEVIEHEQQQKPAAMPGQAAPLDPATVGAERVAAEIQFLTNAAGEGRESLAKAWKEVKASYKKEGKAPPLDVDMGYTDLLAGLKD